MRSVKPVSVEDFRLQSSFEAVRQQLLEERCADRWDKPLAYWALPEDRGLPIAFLGWTVRELLETPYNELCATPGIGRKKIQSLVKLLERATHDEPPCEPFGTEEEQPEEVEPGKFDAAKVSEALWVEWRERVERFRVGHEKLGRLTPTLQLLPTVIWHRPLSFYVGHTLEEIRQLKAHGEKRVRAILRVFYEVNRVLVKLDPDGSLAVRLVPPFVRDVEGWIAQVLIDGSLPEDDQVRQHLAIPLVEQLGVDLGSLVKKLVESRLGIYGAPRSVLSQSRQLGVTRARIYQMLDECAKVMYVRWPEGRCQLSQLQALAKERPANEESVRLLNGVVDLFFPDKHERAGGNGCT